MSGFDLSTPTSSWTAVGPKPDRAARWVFIRIFTAETAANARRFLRDLERAAPPSLGTMRRQTAVLTSPLTIRVSMVCMMRSD